MSLDPVGPGPLGLLVESIAWSPEDLQQMASCSQVGFIPGWDHLSVQSCVSCQPSLFKAFTKQIPKGCCQDATFTTVKIFFNYFTSIVLRVFSISAIIFAEKW